MPTYQYLVARRPVRLVDGPIWGDLAYAGSEESVRGVFNEHVYRAIELHDGTYEYRLVARIEPCANMVTARCMYGLNHNDDCQETAVVDCPAFFAQGKWGYWCQRHFLMAGAIRPELVNVIVPWPIDLVLEEM
jgi:hypothetical protein